MAHWQLVADPGDQSHVLPDGVSVLGRGAGCQIRLEDDTISRQHAELSADPAGISVRDLGSSNGVRVNSVRVAHARLAVDDVVTFGRLAFRVRPADPARPRPPQQGMPPGERAPAELPPGTVVRAIPVRSSGAALARLQAERLARLVELARRLSGEIELEQLLATVVEEAAALLPADRVALLLAEGEEGGLRVAHSRNRIGTAAVLVPQSIVQRAVLEKNPITTKSARADARFQSGSVVRGQVGAALCVPLLLDEERVLGVLYLDSLSETTVFSESDAALCFAFGGLAAVSIAKAHLADTARREAVARANFERFFAPGIAARIAAQRSGVRPGGERRAVTVLYSDVRGFTGLAESLPPEAVAEQLSEYFAAMVELVFEHGGTLDKFIGDALLAMWGAPLPLEDAADRALAAARAMQAELTLLNARWAEARRPALDIGIGLHHGEAFAGTIGSPRRLEYTVIGDVVNVAARLCEAAGAGEIVLSGSLHARLHGELPAAAVEALALRGREAPVEAYRITTGNSEQ
ncbi:MAG TPA: adenylate/guanylate cyclase domain-containing protein [Gemmatimonadales bacterium]|nr:adenylate/guanylate cyclase domain-containing protein [Gemmatimonadales bacterium]